MDNLDTAGDSVSNRKDMMVRGIIKYLAFGTYLLENGWVGMQGIPTNNNFAHMPWFHYDRKKAMGADIGVTKCLSTFLLKYADKNNDIYQKAAELKVKHKLYGKTLLNGYPDYDPTLFEPASFDPATWNLGNHCRYTLLARLKASIIRHLKM
ncbi:hypothetical protein [Clostridium sp. E02]|uniref:hypothetical protein n=1 Tax=Clostridium sp. E02 TaxID=2487134 RepID=UPI000F53C62A|nr:hypothetical protein [Clostridium sp. E02]